MCRGIFYPIRTCDPNQIKQQNFVEGKRSNFYLFGPPELDLNASLYQEKLIKNFYTQTNSIVKK